MTKSKQLLDEPKIAYKGHLLAGVDEVGRGPLAGDVVAAAVILNPEYPIDGLRDSKKLSEKKREYFYDLIYERATAVSVAAASVAEIDEINILHASLLAMKRAVETLAVCPEYVLVDGNQLPKWQLPCEAIVQGDNRIDCIRAASIIAKVTRDRQMLTLAKEFPQYQFEKHKGYPTKVHLQALQEYGITEHHRHSFAPVRRLVGT